MPENINPAEELKSIEQRRSALEKAVRVTLAIERLQNGIEAAMQMGKEAVDIDPKAKRLMDELEPETKSLPSNKLKETLAHLEAIVRTRLTHILKISAMDEHELISVTGEKVEALVTEYQKKAQTALAVRVLLATRGEFTPPIKTEVAPHYLRKRISALSAKEKVYRKAIKTELTSMIDDTVRILARTDLPEKMRITMEAAKLDFEDNLIHLNTDKSISTLPVAIEMVEMSDHQISRVSTQSMANGSDPHIEKQALFNTSEPPPPPMASEQLVSLNLKQKQTFFVRLWRWATTPSTVKWKDLKYKPPKPK